MVSLSICIITCNEEHNIRRCLESVSWANEIVVFDSGSTDKTVAICHEYTQQVFITEDWPGYGVQRERAIAKATGDWVLLIDADEEITPRLKQEIQATLAKKNNVYAGYEIPFQSHFCGYPIKYGDWNGETHLRLVQRNKATMDVCIVHEKVLVNGKIGLLNNKILHHSFPNLQQVIYKINLYSDYGARKNQLAGSSASIFTAIGHGVFAFVRSYIIKLGFLDGKYGFMLAIAQAEGSYYKYLKLSLMR